MTYGGCGCWTRTTHGSPMNRVLWSYSEWNHDHSRWWTLASCLLGIGTVVVYLVGGGS